jgi:hypothetical protein
MHDSVLCAAESEWNLQIRLQLYGAPRHFRTFERAWHDDVCEKEIDMDAAAQHGQRLIRIVRLEHAVAELAEHLDNRFLTFLSSSTTSTVSLPPTGVAVRRVTGSSAATVDLGR